MRTEPNNKRKQQMQTTNANNKRKQQTQATSASNKRKQQAQATNARTNGGEASRLGKRSGYYLVACVILSFLYSDAGTRLLKNSPTRDASPPLVVAFRGSV